MAVASVARKRCESGFISVRVALAPSSATCTRRFWQPTSIQQPLSPRVPSTSGIGKVRRRACGQHTSECKNARKRGRCCPKALVFPEPERVCPKVCVNRHKSRSCSSEVEGWKRGRNAQNPPCCSQGSSQLVEYIFYLVKDVLIVLLTFEASELLEQALLFNGQIGGRYYFNDDMLVATCAA